MSDVLTTVATAVGEHFGHQPQRASVSFVGVDPVEVLRFEPIPGERAYVSLGMSRHPMTGADAAILTDLGPRAELMLHLRDPVDHFADVWRRVALLAAAPAVEGVVYAPGMSVEIGEPLVPGSACVGVVVIDSPLERVSLDDVALDDVALDATPVAAMTVASGPSAGDAVGDGIGREVSILQVLPATSTELAWCRVRGSAALRERWDAAGTDLLDLLRRPVPLD